MSESEIESGSSLPTEQLAHDYNLPPDQDAAKLKLLANYEAQFPGSPSLHTAISTLDKFVRGGIEVPADEPLTGRSLLMSAYRPVVSEGKNGEPEVASLVLMDSRGDHPIERAIRESMYELTGAKVWRDDRQGTATRGIVLRRGEYDSRPIFFLEEYDEYDGPVFRGGRRKDLKLTLLNEDQARALVVDR